MSKRLLSTLTATIAVPVALGLGSASVVSAAAVPVVAGPNTFEATSESGSGAMTASAAVEAYGGPADEHAGRYAEDHYGQVGAFASATAGATHRVTVTLDEAVADESATRTATARGYVEVDLYDCCFAGATSPLGTGAEAELPATPGTVVVTQDVVVPDDTQLNVNVKLHADVAATTNTFDAASVDASAAATSVDITKIADAPPAAERPQPRCILFLCF